MSRVEKGRISLLAAAAAAWRSLVAHVQASPHPPQLRPPVPDHRVRPLPPPALLHHHYASCTLKLRPLCSSPHLPPLPHPPPPPPAASTRSTATGSAGEGE